MEAADAVDAPLVGPLDVVAFVAQRALADRRDDDQEAISIGLRLRF